MKAVIAFITAAFSLFIPATESLARPDINNPKYWISKLKSPDKVVLRPDAISRLNKDILEKTDQMADIRSMPDEVPGAALREWLTIDGVPGEFSVKRYNAAGEELDGEFLKEVSENMALDEVEDSNPVRFGVITERADVRAWPTDEALQKSPESQEFDYLQYSSIYPPEQVALLHTSADGEWGFFQTSTVRGWIRLDKVAFSSREAVFAKGRRFLVATGSEIEVYGDSSLEAPLVTVPMGTALYLNKSGKRKKNEPWKVLFPQRDGDGELAWTEAYISPKSDAALDYLPYTRRNVIKQAFKMLGEEYGWGGKDGKRDCSNFIKDLFAVFGIRMPRNSKQQGSIGHVKARHEDDSVVSRSISAALKKAKPGITILTLKRHVMLHIGFVKGKPFVIHQIFGYGDGGDFKVLNKVAVTGLDLGKKSKEGPFRKRIRSVTEIVIPKNI